jgi:hypothetical protein
VVGFGVAVLDEVGLGEGDREDVAVGVGVGEDGDEGARRIAKAETLVPTIIMMTNATTNVLVTPDFEEAMRILHCFLLQFSANS